MKLSDVVANAGLGLYAEIALILFFVVFVAVMLRTWRASDRDELEAQRLLPLEPETPAEPREGASR